MRRFISSLVLIGLCGFGSMLVARGQIIVGPGTVIAPKPKASENPAMKLLDVGQTAPDWKLVDDQGNTRALSDYRGKVVVMDFWATWCGPCSAVMPRMQKLHEKFANSGVVVFGINSWEKSDPTELMKEKRYSYGLLLNGEGIADSYRVTMLPVVYVIGYDGEVIYCHQGVDHKNLSSVIEKYLKAKVIPKAA